MKARLTWFVISAAHMLSVRLREPCRMAAVRW